MRSTFKGGLALPAPRIFVRTKSLHERVAPNIPPGFPAQFRVAQAMIEVVLLPLHALEARHAPFPIAHGARHPRCTRKGDQGVKVVGHQQEQFTPLSSQRMITPRRIEQRRREPGISQRRVLVGCGTDAHVKERAVLDPRRGAMVQPQRKFIHAPDTQMERVDRNAPFKRF